MDDFELEKCYVKMKQDGSKFLIKQRGKHYPLQSLEIVDREEIMYRFRDIKTKKILHNTNPFYKLIIKYLDKNHYFESYKKWSNMKQNTKCIFREVTRLHPLDRREVSLMIEYKTKVGKYPNGEPKWSEPKFYHVYTEDRRKASKHKLSDVIDRDNRNEIIKRLCSLGVVKKSLYEPFDLTKMQVTRILKQNSKDIEHKR